MPEDQDLGCQRRSRPEQPDQHRPNKAAGFLHRTERLRDSASVVSPIEFTTGTVSRTRNLARSPRAERLFPTRRRCAALLSERRCGGDDRGLSTPTCIALRVPHLPGIPIGMPGSIIANAKLTIGVCRTDCRCSHSYSAHPCGMNLSRRDRCRHGCSCDGLPRRRRVRRGRPLLGRMTLSTAKLSRGLLFFSKQFSLSAPQSRRGPLLSQNF